MTDIPGEPSPEAFIPIGPRPILPILPIFFIFRITALLPSIAIIGDPGFTLTVQGSGFAQGATVTWNQSNRVTTFVSANQLTALITANDIAATGSASVQVVNAGGAVSNALTFTIVQNISDIINTLQQVSQTFATLQQFQAIQPQLTAALSELQGYITSHDAILNDLKTQLGTAQANEDALTNQNATLNTQVTQLNAQVAQLQAQVAAAKNQTATPFEVAQSLKTMFDQIHQTTQSSAGVQSSLTNLHFELKTLINVQRDTPAGPASALLVFPDPTALPDPAHLSTMQLSFGAVPNLHAGSPANVTPPAPAPGPAPTPPSGTS